MKKRIFLLAAFSFLVLSYLVSGEALIWQLSLMAPSAAFAIDIPNSSTWTQYMGVQPGRGDVLIAPIYDVRQITDSTNTQGGMSTVPQDQFTLFCVKNTDRDYGTVLRMRFREWKRGRECLNIDIPLTTNDVWCGELSRNTTGGGFILQAPLQDANRLVDIDRVDGPVTVGSVSFPNGYFQGALFPTAGIDSKTNAIEAEEPNKPARCELGYIEFIGEERVKAPVTTSEPWKFPRLASTDDIVITGDAPWPFAARGRDAQDVLMGEVFIIRPDQGMSHKYAMFTLSDFAVDPAGIWNPTSTARPNLFQDVQGQGTNPGIGGFDQLEAILARRFIYTDYLTAIDPNDPTHTYTSTSLVVTFPTKNFHYDTNTLAHAAGGVAGIGAPFTGLRETYNDHLVTPSPLTAGQVGESVLFKIYDRKKTTFASCLPIDRTIPCGKLPYEVNVIGFYPSTAIIAPIFRNNVVTDTTDGGTNVFNTGYMIIDLGNHNQGKDNITFTFFGLYYHSYNGLPAVGIEMQELFNDATLQYYGNTIPWQYRVDRCDSATCPIQFDLSQSPGEHSWR